MMPPQAILDFLRAQPFCAFRILMTSGRTIDIHHPELVKVLRNTSLIFKATGDTTEIPDGWESVSLMLTESIAHLEVPTHRDTHGRSCEAAKHLLLHQGAGISSQETSESLMITYQRVLDYVRAEPFRPFRIHTASSRTFDVRHPEMIKVLRNYILIFKSLGETQDVPDEFDTVSLMLTESISHLETPVH